jgi:bacterioferritin (cytochrome b1)
VKLLAQNGKQDIGLAKHGERKFMTNIDNLIKLQESNIEQSVEAQEVTGYSSNDVIDLLKRSLNIHWQQTTSLTAQAVHLERWGYKKLAAVIKEDAEQEHEHTAVNLARLEFFDVDYQPLSVNPPSWTRHDMVAMINYNLNSVREAAAAERATITAARSVGDEMTAHIMIPLLQGSEDGIKLYESYLKLIEQMGLENFLTLQV